MKIKISQLISLLCLGITFSCAPPKKFQFANEAELTIESSDSLDKIARFRWGISSSDVKLNVISTNKHEKSNTMTMHVKSYFCGINDVELGLTFQNDKLVLFDASPYTGTDLNEAAQVINNIFEFIHQFDQNFPLAFPRLTSGIINSLPSQNRIIDLKIHRLLALIIPIKKMPRHINLNIFINFDFEDSNKFRVDFSLMPA